MRSATTLALVFLALSGRAQADHADEEIARAHFNTGTVYYESRRFDAAAHEFLEAYRFARRPELLYNIARTYEKLQDPGRATRYYRRYLAAVPAARERRTISKQIARMAPQVATLLLEATVAGTEVAIDGEVVGKVPLESQLVTAGHHRISAEHEGYLTTIVEVELRGGESNRVGIDPRKVVAMIRPALSPTSPPVALLAPLPPLPTVAEKPAPRPRWLWPVVGVGAAVVVGAVVGVVLAFTAGINYGAVARSRCIGGGCVLFDGTAGM